MSSAPDSRAGGYDDRPRGRPPGDDDRGPRRGGPGGGPDRRGGGGPRGRFRRRKVCIFCVEKIDLIDYKATGRLRSFISERGKIDPRRKTGCCAGHQRKVTTAIKRARKMALLPYTIHHVQETGIYELRG
jgi:small subunit ribosomal protein S18